MKKIILIAVILVLCASFVSAADILFVVDNEGMASDVVHIINTVENLKNKGLLEEGDYEDTTVQDLDEGELDDKIALFIVNNEATIFIGYAAPSDFSEEIADSLKEVSGINAKIVYLEEDESDDLTGIVNVVVEEEENATETNETSEPEENATETNLTENPEENITQPEIEPGQVEIENGKPGLFETIINWFKSLFGI